MTSPICQESGPFKEWAPLTTLLQKIPLTIQIGLFPQNINITCIDVVPEFFAIGTNYGFVYWYDRKSGKIETLRCENINSSIKCVKIVSTVDYMVAAGTTEGVVTIFQIPKEIPDSLPEIFKPKKKKQVERFNVSGLHKASVTALEWSKNGMKLFSGDEDGLVALTEIDFNLHLSKSTELLNEKYAVVQLSFLNGLLLISTLFRAIIVNINQNNQVTQIGQTERKMLGKLGAVFTKNKNHVQEPLIYTSRPGLRIWQADKNGTVLKTLILKEAVKSEQNRVEVLNPAARVKKHKNKELTFGVVMPFSENLLITYNEDMIYIVDPTEIKIVTIVSDLRQVTDVACSEDEIFIIEGERNIVRIATYPDISFSDADEPVELSTILTESFNSVTLGFSELTSKLKHNPIVPVINKINPADLIKSTSILPTIVTGYEENSIIDAEEALEVPPIVPLDLETSLVTGIDLSKNHNLSDNEDKSKSTNRKYIFQKIGEQEFEDVVFVPRKNEKKSRNHFKNDSHLKQEKIITNNDDKIHNHDNNLKDNYGKLPSLDYSDDSIVNPGKELESIEKAVRDKEKLLSNFLELDLSKYKDKKKIDTSKSNLLSSNNDHIEDSPKNYFPLENCGKMNEIEFFEEKKISQENGLLNFLKPTNSLNYDTQIFEVDLNNQIPQNSKSNLDRNKISEINFNALSKEFVKSTINQENDDWVLLG